VPLPSVAKMRVVPAFRPLMLAAAAVWPAGIVTVTGAK
jgi:hypothetical protein